MVRSAVEAVHAGDRVRVPWGLDVLDGQVLQVDLSGSRARAVIQVDLPGPPGQEGEPVTVTLPLEALQPADWWPDEKSPLGGWASAGSYERHVFEAVKRIISTSPDVTTSDVQSGRDPGFDLLVESPQGIILIIIKYFFRSRAGLGQMRQLSRSLHHAVDNATQEVRGALVITNVDVGGRTIDQQLQERAGVAIEVRSVKWRSAADDQALKRVLTYLLSIPIASDPVEDSTAGSAGSTVPLGATVETGQECPESGLWEVVGMPSITMPVAKGQVMPPYAGKPVIWELQRYA